MECKEPGCGDVLYEDRRRNKNYHIEVYKAIETATTSSVTNVYADGKLLIHQTSIPALPGNEGFKTKQDAEKVVLLVIDKIKRGEMPPTVTIEELKKLKVIK